MAFDFHQKSLHSFFKSESDGHLFKQKREFYFIELSTKTLALHPPLVLRKKFFFLLWRKGREKEKERGEAESF